MLAFLHPQSSIVFISPKQKLSHSVGYSEFIVILERTVRIHIVPVTYSSARDKALHGPGCDELQRLEEVLVLEQAMMCFLWDHCTVQIRVLFKIPLY